MDPRFKRYAFFFFTVGMNTCRNQTKSIHESVKLLNDSIRTLDENQEKMMALLQTLIEKVNYCFFFFNLFVNFLTILII